MFQFNLKANVTRALSQAFLEIPCVVESVKINEKTNANKAAIKWAAAVSATDRRIIQSKPREVLLLRGRENDE